MKRYLIEYACPRCRLMSDFDVTVTTHVTMHDVTAVCRCGERFELEVEVWKNGTYTVKYCETRVAKELSLNTEVLDDDLPLATW